ncbi:class I SAM-dependent methyltransferase [Bacillus wiedmannii]|uniref:class I SAM-dependent methyltransferase n=1 Tax=Bacillus wiedmannii TaxID=1890302 RepID=UPI0010BD1D61|nr:class I SAM-dependent methyltransferase [Bacillus wiedmannii]TKH23314.1 class I SAM-dependent methyltransferase [Bacillus wiedmannii]
MIWIKHNPKFEYETEYPNIKKGPWGGHIDFAYDLIRFLKPQTIVELGTFYGTSFFSFCQAVKDEKCETVCYAIDTWKGDEHGGFYGDEVYTTVNYLVQKYYKHIGNLIKSTFDGTLHTFKDETIDVLHIDGYHTYEAVSHDYETWLPKLRSNGVVLFHDITVYYENFGVHKLWAELSSKNPAFSFKHSNGLGILFPKGCNEKANDLLTSFNEIQKQYVH